MSDLQTLLTKFRISKEDKTTPSTHTRMPEKDLNIWGGSYSVSEEDEKEFYNALYEYLIIQNKKEYLTEKQLENKTFVVDMDFRYCYDVSQRQHTTETLDDIVFLFLDQIKKFSNDIKPFKVYAMEKPNVNRLEDKQITKDGIHLLFTFAMNKEYKLLIRDEMIKESPKKFELPLINSWEDVYDEGIFKETCNWTIYGCQKPGHESYKVVKIYDCEFDNNDKEFKTDIIDNPKITSDMYWDLSVRKHRNIMNPNKEGLNGITQLKLKLKLPIVNQTSPRSVAELELSKEEKTDKYEDLLFNVIGNGSHIDFKCWFQIAGILKCNNYKFEVLEKYTAIVDKANPRTESIWNGINIKKPMSIYGLQNIAKQINIDGYFKWLEKHNEIITLDILQKGSNDVCKFITNSLKDILIYCKSNWYACINNLWSISDNPNSIIVSAIQDEIDKLLKIHTDKVNKSFDDEQKQKERKTIGIINELRRQVCSCMRQYRELLQGYLLNNEFSNILDMNKYQVAYKNGILDLRTLEFHEGISPNDFITRTIPFDYEKADKDDKKYIREQLKKICNYNEDHLNYYLSIIGYSMTGDADKRQEFYYLRGQKASNGKSVVFEAFDDIMPCYCRKMGRDVFDPKNTTLHKEIAVWRGVRIAWANEVSAKMDAEMLKDVSDGKGVSFKGIYKNADIMPISFKPFIVSNHSPTIDSDAGVKRRIRISQFDSDFSEDTKPEDEDYVKCIFYRDQSFGEKLVNKYKHALLELVFEYSKKFYDYIVDPVKNPIYQYPAEWKKQSSEALEQNDSFKEWFLDTFEFGSGEDFTISDYTLKKILKNNNFGNVKFNDQVAKNRWATKKDDSKKWNGIRQKQVSLIEEVN